MYNNYEIIIASPSDRENLVAEIWHDGRQLAEISNEREGLRVTFSINDTQYVKAGSVVDLDFEECIIALIAARLHLKRSLDAHSLKMIEEKVKSILVT